MKILSILTVFVIVLNCKPSSAIEEQAKASSQANICPENGECSFKVFPNKSFVIKKDEFGLTYGELIESDHSLLQFEYIKNVPENTADGHYSELIYIELEPNVDVLNLQDEDLKAANVSFGRFCFCKGETGYYAITKGHLTLQKTSKNLFSLSLEFKTDEVPQIITQIHQEFELKK